MILFDKKSYSKTDNSTIYIHINKFFIGFFFIRVLNIIYRSNVCTIYTAVLS